ncbi:hypothetical protein BU15DRAFT_68131 [Melanogaster broomeanus]|nr:hypothetical protein BU15DRAFT_68131 [Melanogaster broomeanus]
MSYEDLVADPTKSNIIQKLVDSFPWWPDLHGWWRKNPAYNNSSAGFIADSGQNLETETLLTFKRGGEGSKRRGAEVSWGCTMSNNNVISLNSDDESDRMPCKRPIITATLQPCNPPPAVDISDSDNSIMFGHARRSPSSRQTPTEDSDSSSRLSPITGLTSQAGTTSQAAGTSLSGSQSRKRPRETPADKLANRFTDTSEALVKQLQETRLARLEGKRQKREHEKWVREQDAAEADRERDLKRSLASSD